MNNKFDELTKGLAQSTTRRAALKKFGSGLVGVALVTLGLANKADANPRRGGGAGNCDNCNLYTNFGCGSDPVCYNRCYQKCVPSGGY